MASVFQIRRKDTGEFVTSSYCHDVKSDRGYLWLKKHNADGVIVEIEGRFDSWENAKRGDNYNTSHPYYKDMVNMIGPKGNLEVVEFELVEK